MSRNIQGENVKLKTINLHLENQITQLTNNWNELEEWIIKGTKEEPYERGDMFFKEICEIILDKMKEIKDGKDND